MKILEVLLILLACVKSEKEKYMPCIPGSIVMYDTARCFCGLDGQEKNCESFYFHNKHPQTSSIEVINKSCIPGHVIQNKTTRCFCSSNGQVEKCKLIQTPLSELRTMTEGNESCTPGSTFQNQTTKCVCNPDGQLDHCENLADVSVVNSGITAKIVGGQETDITQHSFVVSLLAGNRREHFCGGSIIDDYWVITAAHCVDMLTMDLFIRAGSNIWHQSGHIFKAVKIISNRKFSWKTFDFDIAVVKVDKPFLSSNLGLSKITLPPFGIVIPADSKVTVLGWGKTSEEGELSNVLRKVTLPIISKKDCAVKFGSFITNNMLCAGYKQGTMDACLADSGGPLVLNDTLWGIVSFGDGCARANTPGVYSRVSTLRCWIKCNTGI